MKLNKYSWLAALPMIFTACQEDTLVENQQQDKIYTLSAVMDDGAAMSRAQVQLGNTDASVGEKFFWNVGDSFVMYQNIENTWNKSTFSTSGYSEDDMSETATFSTDNPATVGVDFTAFYPASQMNSYDEFSAHLPSMIEFPEDKTTDEVWANYFKDWMLMIAEGNLSEQNPSIEFKHVCCLARITYTNKTGKELPITRYYLEGNDWLIGVAYYHNPTTGEISYGAHERKYGLNVSGLTVPADESVDLYLLFYPHEFGNNEKLYVGIDHQEDDWLKAEIGLSEIAAANNGAEAFEAGKRYWFKVTETLNGLYWTKEYAESRVDVETFDAFRNALNQEDVTHIALKNPIIISEELDNLNIYLNNKIVTLSEDFSWNVNGEEKDALFVNKNKYLRFSYGRIEATEDTYDNKYLFTSTAANGDLGFDRVDMKAGGKMNAIKTEVSSSLYLNGNNLSIIDVENGNALSVTTSDDSPSSIYISFDSGIINGDIYFANNYNSNENEASYIRVWNGTINGNLNIDGEYPNDLDVEIQYDLNNENVDSFIEHLFSTNGDEFTVKLSGNNETNLANVAKVIRDYSTTSDKLINLILRDVYQLPESVFESCHRLKSVDAERVNTASSYAFWECINLERVNLPSLYETGEQFFRRCSKLVEVNIPRVTSLGYGSFWECTSLVELNLPYVTSIDAMSFYDCTSLTSLVLVMPIETFGSQTWSGFGMLNNASNIDLTLSPYQWKMNNMGGYYATDPGYTNFWLEGETEKEDKMFCGHTFKSVKKGE